MKLHSLPRQVAAVMLAAGLLLAAGCASSAKHSTPDDPAASLRVSHQLNADLPDDIDVNRHGVPQEIGVER